MENQDTAQIPQRHVCGICGDEWLSEAEYNSHVCPGSGYAPTQAEHLIATTQPDFADIQQAALDRGAENQDQAAAEPDVPAPTMPDVTLQ